MEARILNNSGKTISKYLLYEACLFADASNSSNGGYIEMYENALEVGKNELGLSWFKLVGFLLLQNFCVAISVSPHVCFILVLILISMFLR